MSNFQKRKFLIILISPSGGGKSVILQEVLKRNPDIDYSISYTTRKIRRNEINGKSYNFVSIEEFKAMYSQGEFLESAKVHGNYYGTSLNTIKKIISSGRLVIMDIDVQGARQIQNQEIDCITIFILPPSRQIWLQRLKDRGTDSSEEIEKRRQNAETEIDKIADFQYLVINDDLKKAVTEVEYIIRAEENKIPRYKNIIKNFKGE